MTPEQFCYWLQGRVETRPNTPPTKAEWRIIKDHLKLVFDKQTPEYIPTPVFPTFPTPVYPGEITCAGGEIKIGQLPQCSITTTAGDGKDLYVQPNFQDDNGVKFVCHASTQ